MDSKYSSSASGDNSDKRKARRKRIVNGFDEITDSMEGLSDEYSEYQKDI